MQEEVDTVKISEAQIKILRSILGERIYFFYSDKLQVEGDNGCFLFWANGFALALSTIHSAPGMFRTYINISADYRLSSRESATYYVFDITVSSAPLWQEGALQFSKLSSLRIFSDPILMIEIYQNNGNSAEKIVTHDCAMVFYSPSRKLMLKARQELIGGVDIILDEAFIDAQVKKMKLRSTLV
ncbi:hypothetical protein [Pontibacter ruber]|uniref:Uncharacterized protein n=1 Tax=Pontibacter ruber TaxID=1343895 RepID=A0ABW5CYH1_9BACT|nr:hypothetical protein [Pontibacter ruber]